MKKVIRLTESNLVNIVKQVLLEQNFSEIRGTTDPTPIAKLSVLTDAGLPADENNFRGRWMLEVPNINRTFNETKNLSLFKNQTPKSPAGGENYIEMTVQRFVPNQLNPDRTIKVKGGADTTTPPIIESLTNNGSKTFNVKYPDPDGKHVWSLIRIVASGNGLLALSRALLESTGTPNKITIGMSQSTRESGGYTYNASRISNIAPTLNLISNMVVGSIITKSGLDSPSTKKLVSGDPSGSLKFIGLTNEVIADSMARYLYTFDQNFIPENQIETFRKKVDPSGKPLLPNYNSKPFLDILNKIPQFNDVQGLFDGNNGDQRWSNVGRTIEQQYSAFNEQFRIAVIEQYKKRLIAFFTNVYKDENQANQLVNSTQFRDATLTIERSFENAIKGVKYTGTASAPKAGEMKTSNTYEVGKSKPTTQK